MARKENAREELGLPAGLVRHNWDSTDGRELAAAELAETRDDLAGVAAGELHRGFAQAAETVG